MLVYEKSKRHKMLLTNVGPIESKELLVLLKLEAQVINLHVEVINLELMVRLIREVCSLLETGNLVLQMNNLVELLP